MFTVFHENGVVNPPIVNRATNPKANTIGVVYRIDPPQHVASHEKILIPVGTAIIIVKQKINPNIKSLVKNPFPNRT